MNQVKLKELISEKKIVIPLFMLKKIKEFNINIDEFILLLYLYDEDKCVFNPEKISIDLNINILNVMENISNLSDKGLIKVNAIKNDKGIMEEVIDLSNLYEMLSLEIIKELNEKEETDININDIIEEEFGRRLTPLEHEMILDWEKNNYNKELIREAVKEASINGVTTLRYIDKILFDWDKQGIKTKEDIKKNIKKDEKVEIYSCDWLNEDDEEI